MRKLRTFGVLLTLAVGIGIAGPDPAEAATITYLSRASWEAAIPGSPDFVETFHGVTSDEYFQSSPRNFGPFSMVQMGSQTGTACCNLIDADTPLLPGFGVDSTSYALLRVQGSGPTPTSVEIEFDAPVGAWGVDLGGYGGTEGVVVELRSGGTPILLVLPLGSPFFGFVSGGSVSSLSFMAQNPDLNLMTGVNFGMDNMTGFARVVPEPATAFLFAAGLAALAATPRRRAP